MAWHGTSVTGQLRCAIDFELATAHLRLRPIAAADTDLLLELDSDPEVMRFLTGGRPSTRDEITETIRDSIGHRWLAFLSGDSAEGTRKDAPDGFVGWFGLAPGPGHGDRQLGYRLLRSMWGRGFATEGASAMVDYGFTELGAARIWAQTMTVNTASRRVMERCGLRYVRTFYLDWDDPIDGAELGDVEYELTRADWSAAAP
jgi:RimJ/RimL family protein N-acetyltransferase